ncbi:piggyBac transposable element-derived protein 2-like [Mercenaria mercenaria]|uniref:piggyBac transposable element-derived protein 2-like n=1 Tax=Mercenaria mercenaria TaxID=6596 RepID=UPI00234ECD9F|nr:piggyBac transposable element-derived protein 2-like [Mercenaria mercenaria]
MKLVSTLPEKKNYKIFTDNYFTSVSLVKALKEKQILFVGTIRQNRLKCDLKSEKELKQNGRGSVDSKVETSSNIIAVRWYDNKSVNLVSSYVGVEPVEEVRRWDKKHKTYVQVNRPAIVGVYNRNMGGVDLLDSLCSLYKPPVKSRRWYMYIFWHTIMMAVVNAWLCHKKHATLLGTNSMKLPDFINHVAGSLIETTVRVGRPPLTAVLNFSPPQKLKNSSSKLPSSAKCLDGTGHLPLYEDKRQRCKHSGCDGFSFVKCVKCGVHLCFNRNKNCYMLYHV